MQPPKQDFKHTLNSVDSDEKLLAIIKRHPFGIVKLYAQVFVAVSLMAGLVYYMLPEFFLPEDNAVLYSLVGLGVVLIGAFLLIIAFVATIIYNQNMLVVTDKTITQTLQISLFNKKVSQLAVSSIEDVTAKTNGVLPTVVGYGRLIIETAGEQENFHFDYCPHADHYAKLILETRQNFLSTREMERQEAGERYVRNQQHTTPPQPQYAPPMPQPAQAQWNNQNYAYQDNSQPQQSDTTQSATTLPSAPQADQDNSTSGAYTPS